MQKFPSPHFQNVQVDKLLAKSQKCECANDISKWGNESGRFHQANLQLTKKKAQSNANGEQRCSPGRYGRCTVFTAHISNTAKILYNCYFARHKSHTDWPGTEAGSPQWHAKNQPSGLRSKIDRACLRKSAEDKRKEPKRKKKRGCRNYTTRTLWRTLNNDQFKANEIGGTSFTRADIRNTEF